MLAIRKHLVNSESRTYNVSVLLPLIKNICVSLLTRCLRIANNSSVSHNERTETMSATPLIPGRLYRVRGAGLDLKVIASHPCDALCIGLDLLERAKC